MLSDYRLSRPLAARMLGAVVALSGVVVVLATLAVGLLEVSGGVLTAAVLAAAGLVLAGVVLLWRGPALVHLDATGYRVRLLRGAGVSAARWTDVEDVVAGPRAGEWCVVLRLRDGRTTTIPVRMLDARPEGFVADLRSHLDAGHGYRRIT